MKHVPKPGFKVSQLGAGRERCTQIAETSGRTRGTAHLVKRIPWLLLIV